MANHWIEEPIVDNEFDAFLGLLDAMRAGKTQDPARLRLKIQRTWQNFTFEKKHTYTRRLLDLGRLEEQFISPIKDWHGTIVELYH